MQKRSGLPGLVTAPEDIADTKIHAKTRTRARGANFPTTSPKTPPSRLRRSSCWLFGSHSRANGYCAGVLFIVPSNVE